ncbi:MULTISPECIES: alcohol dehydrogenase catalytic domain-containing protein [Micrococcus]|uniref:alcohol dehydrogenase catalytic domain-containing protein n=1 Tax=Micrococcus TaxID=1269 RepID=UPI001EF2B9ED|nr:MULTISPECIES: alcohol dehydrogenase catalytic domain-containing protein [Micrococcus]
MVASGVCHTDAIVRDQWYPTPLPAVLGHEGAGVVEEVGAGVVDFAPGDRVLLSYSTCGHCRACMEGAPAYCKDFFSLNFGGAAHRRFVRLHARRRAGLLPLLRSELVRGPGQRAGSLRGQGRRGRPSRDPRASGLWHPDRRRRRAERAPPRTWRHRGRVRRWCSRSLSGDGREGRPRGHDHRRGHARGPPPPQ